MRPSLRFALVAACVSCGPAAAWAHQTTPPPARPARPRPPVARPASTFEYLSKQADAAREAKELDKAAGLYKQALALKPDWLEGLWNLGTICYDLDRHEEANDAFKRLLAKDPSSGVTWVFKGLTAFRLKRYDEALSDLLQARSRGVTADRDIAEAARYHTAILLTRNEQYDQALAVLSDFGLEGNDSPRIIEALGLATLRMPMLPDELPGPRRELVMLAGRAQYFMAARLPPAPPHAPQNPVFPPPPPPHPHYPSRRPLRR